MDARISLMLAAAVSVAAAVPSAGAAQGSFEGVVTFQVQGEPGGAVGRQQTMRYSIKGDRVRWDVSSAAGDVYWIMSGAKKVVDMVIPMRRMYLERGTESARAMMDSATAGAKVTWTGKKETIAGHECEDATVTQSDGSTVALCLAKDLGAFLPMGGGQGAAGRTGGGWESVIGQSCPLKVVRDGTVELLATKIEKESLPDSLFEVPAGYTKMSLPGMGGGL